MIEEPKLHLPSNGIVEGFYWDEDNQLDGQWGEFTHMERRKLLKFLGENNYNSYAYAPKINREENIGEKSRRLRSSEWQETFRIAKEHEIDFYWGVAPGFLYKEPHPDEYDTRSLIFFMTHLVELGVAGFVLSFDDTEGGSTISQMKRQAQLVKVLRKQTNIGRYLHAFVPGIYADYKAEEAGFATPEEGLAILNDELPIDLPIIYCGKQNWNFEINATSFPKLGNRKYIFWDNHVAGDRSDFIKVGPPYIRDPNMFTVTNGYWLNGIYPAMRTVPILAGLAEILKSGGAILGNIEHQYIPSEVLPILQFEAGKWAQYLDLSQYESNIFELIKGLCELDYDQELVDQLPQSVFKAYLDELVKLKGNFP